MSAAASWPGRAADALLRMAWVGFIVGSGIVYAIADGVGWALSGGTIREARRP